MYDDADAEQNRADACSFLTGSPPAGANCDEYPMAHTYQGAYTGGDNPADFSAEWVNETQNSSAGGKYGSFANQQRLLKPGPVVRLSRHEFLTPERSSPHDWRRAVVLSGRRLAVLPSAAAPRCERVGS
ncbi:NucA/NucB deoxyribonuclease domain-containing protein [Nonomuraea sp. 10N515B]|uniref:NucA/NucB deoxyribonuclease domain-containing protein n=1 Tax=Nonomuraea sp. 10N515B TaxID=3457422 RepID=UPI003FCD9186